jgi:hypothetical protein
VANIETGFRKDRYLIAEPDLAIAQLPDDKGIYRASEVWRPAPPRESPALLALARERFQRPPSGSIPLRTEATRRAHARSFEPRPSATLPR